MGNDYFHGIGNGLKNLQGLGAFEFWCVTIINLSIMAVAIAIIIDFALFQKNRGTKKAKKSIVETGTMTGFFLLFCLVIKTGFGKISFESIEPVHWMIGIGTLMIVKGAVLNIVGRFQLGNNWANHIRIYENHSLITGGLYRFVRHPLYSSIMLMLFGGSVVYRNWASFLAVAVIFIPFMNYRAKQEEVLLREAFPEYQEYAKKVGRFFPKFGKK